MSASCVIQNPKNSREGPSWPSPYGFQTFDGLAFGQATACRKLLAAGRSGKTRRGCPESVAGGGHGKRVAEQLKNGFHFRNDLGLLNHF